MVLPEMVDCNQPQWMCMVNGKANANANADGVGSCCCRAPTYSESNYLEANNLPLMVPLSIIYLIQVPKSAISIWWPPTTNICSMDLQDESELPHRMCNCAWSGNYSWLGTCSGVFMQKELAHPQMDPSFDFPCPSLALLSWITNYWPFCWLTQIKRNLIVVVNILSKCGRELWNLWPEPELNH